MISNTKGIVLNQIKFSETSVIVRVYTKEFGKQSYIIKGAGKKRSKNKANILQPLFLLDMIVYHKPKNNIHNIKECKLAYPLTNIPYNIYKSSIAFFVVEVLNKVLKEEEKNEDLFNFIYNAILILDTLEEDYANFHIYFLIHLTKFLGFFPNKNYSNINKYFAIDMGYFTDSKQSYYPNEILSKIIFDFLNADIHNFNQIKLNKMYRNVLLNDIITFYKYHVEDFKNLRSLQILQEIFE